MYISPVYNYASGKQLIYQNTFTHILTALAFGGPVKDVKGCDIAIYRNVFDLRGAVRYARPTSAKPTVETVGGHVIGDHGSPPWPTLDFYQNTILTLEGQRTASMGLFATPVPERPRRILNNLLVSGGKLPAYVPLTEPTALEAGNLYWGLGVNEKTAETFFDKYRKSEDFKKSQAANKIGSSTKSIVAQPLFVNDAGGDFRPASGSPVINAGIELPPDLIDPLRAADAGAPDIGALPLNAQPLITGVDAK